MPTKESFDIDGLMVFRSDLTAVDQDGNIVASVTTPDKYVPSLKEPLSGEQIGRYTNTTAYWREHSTYVPLKGDVIVYSDGSTTEQGGVTVYVPKIKIGDGVTTIGNLPFTDSDTQQGTAGTLNTTNTSAQTPSASESLSGNVNLHKVAKTGSYDDLLNKPTIPAAQIQSDWAQNDNTKKDYIKNKPQNIVTDANYVHTDNNYTTTEKNKLAGIESGAEVNVQADWSETDTTSDACILHKPDLDATLYESVTYSQLVSKINNSQLVKGRKYRITDYVTTTTQTNTSSAGHAFDLVVTAIDVNELDCNASALLHSGDTYFSSAGADLSKWQIWYDVNNDTTKYLWADATNGKGVIYRMIDEWGNDCPYDFKNILFTKANSYTSAYTFNKFTSGDTANSDYSLNIQYRNCYENIICEYYKVYGGVKKRNLNFNVFLTTDSTSKCSSNTFECDCYNNTFGDGCSGNAFLSMCYNNTFSDNCRYNVFGSYCNSNIFGNNCFDNSFGTDCYSNIFGNYCYTITLENRCGDIVLGNSSNQGGSYIINMTIKSGNSYVRIYNTTSPSDSNYLKNIYIAQGCSGTSNAYTEISTIARNLTYRTTVGRDSSGNIRIYNEDDPASSSQAQADWNETNSSSPSYIQNKPTLTTVTFRHW